MWVKEREKKSIERFYHEIIWSRDFKSLSGWCGVDFGFEPVQAVWVLLELLCTQIRLLSTQKNVEKFYMLFTLLTAHLRQHSHCRHSEEKENKMESVQKVWWWRRSTLNLKIELSNWKKIEIEWPEPKR